MEVTKLDCRSEWLVWIPHKHNRKVWSTPEDKDQELVSASYSKLCNVGLNGQSLKVKGLQDFKWQEQRYSNYSFPNTAQKNKLVAQNTGFIKEFCFVRNAL